MFLRLVKTFRFPAATLAGTACLLLPLHVCAQDTPAAPAAAQFDPSDVYFQGYLAARAAEQLEKDGDYTASWEKLEQARKLFGSVQRYYPNWKPEMVKGRAEKTSEAITQIRPKADEQKKKQQGAIAELEGGNRAKGDSDSSGQPPGMLEIDPLEARRLAQAEAEVKRLQQSLGESKPNPSDSRDTAHLREVERQRDLAQSQLRAAENTVQQLRSKLAGSPVENEMKSLGNRIEKLEQEKNAMAMALSQSRSEHMDAQAKIAMLEADLKVMKDKAAELRQKTVDQERDITSERDVASKVVAGQRRQIDALEKQLDGKNAELTKAHNRISGLEKELEQSKDAFTQLSGEREALVQERDQMAALLKLNEAGRIQELVEQNMSLAKNLREANEKVERLNLDNNVTKDDMTDALRDLAMAKSQINRLQQEKRGQDKRLADLENRLKGEEASLAAGSASSDPAEVDTLREIIRRQLRVQERRRQARDLLLEAVKQMGTQDQNLAQAIEMFDGQEVQLTPEEQKLIANKGVDGEFVSPFARDRATVGKATAGLNTEIEGWSRAAEKAFLAGRLLPTRELYQMIVDAHPGNASALCKLGVVHLKLKDPTAAVDTFRRAVELDETNSYALRMLGYSYMAKGDMGAAEENVKRSVDQAPDDAKSQTLMGNIEYRLGKISDAEAHFKAAINADPVSSEPYFNLALIYCGNNKLEEARNYYQQALERGALPDPNLEQRIDQQP